MEPFEKSIKEHNLRQQFGIESEFEQPIEEIVKGKSAQIGEIREWHGVKMKKVSSTGNAKQDWQPVKDGDSKKQGEEEGGQEKPSEEDLKEHAKNSSEAALQNAIKTSPDPTVRQIANQELQRRQKEERSGDSDQFPKNVGKEKQSGTNEKKDSEEKDHDPLKHLSEDLKTAEQQLRELSSRARKAYDNSEGGAKEKAKQALDKFAAKLDEIKAKMSVEEGDTKSGEKIDYGITVSDKRSRSTITQESLDRVKETLERYKDKSPESIDNMVANTNQSLSNIQIAAIYQELGIHDKMSSTYSVKQAKKKLANYKKVEKSIQGIRYF